jgi:hypothetical protein
MTISKLYEYSPQTRQSERTKATFELFAGTFVAAALAGLIAVILYSVPGPDVWTTLAMLMAFSIAAVVAGSSVGFLFGVPKSVVATKKDDNSVGAVVASVDPDATQPNTNLEQISDWLTKILVGATLTQLGRVPEALTTLFTNMAAALPNRASAAAMVGAMSIYSALVGFMFGWVSARVWVPYLIKAGRVPSSGQETPNERPESQETEPAVAS